MRSLRGRALFRLLLMVSGAGQLLPLAFARLVGRTMGSVAWLTLARQRRLSVRHIARAFPEWSMEQHRRTVRGMFRHLGETLMEVLWLGRGDTSTLQRLTVMENAAPVLAALAAGRTIVVLSGHCGNWEWGAQATARFAPMSVLQRERTEGELNRFIAALRSKAGIHTIDRGSTKGSRELILATRRAGTLVFLLDQNIRAESASVPFFGIPAPTALGPIKLALRTGAMLATILAERRDGQIYLRFRDLIDTRPDDDPIALAARFTAAVEEQIRRAPEQWVWMHDRWKERPEWDVAKKTNVSQP